MRKLLRDARAFEKRAMMGRFKLWFIVEGRSHDRAFYDELMRAYPGLNESEYELRLAEDFKIGGKSAGGKQFALDLLDLWESTGALNQVDKNGRRSLIVMALDHDFDSLAGLARTSPHVIYTSGMDIESEILRNTDLRKAVRSTYSLPLHVVESIIDDPNAYFARLAELYRTWITLGILATCCGYRSAIRFAQVSPMHRDGFGAIDEVAEWDLIEKVLTVAEAREGLDWIDSIDEKVAEIFNDGEQWRLVKGRWVVKFVCYEISLLDEVIESGIPPSTLAKTALAYLAPDSDCFLHYFKRLDRLFDVPGSPGPRTTPRAA